MTTYLLTKYYYIIERVYFFYRLFILFIITFSFLLFLYTVSWEYKRDYLHASIDILFYIMFFIINTMKKCWTLLYHVRICDTKKVPIWTWPFSPLFVATPLCTVITSCTSCGCFISTSIFYSFKVVKVTQN